MEFQRENENVVLVSRDDIRLMLFKGDHYLYSRQTESMVTEIWRDIIANCLSNGKTVVVHDTNLDPRALENIEALAELFDIDLKCEDFTDVPVEECINRDDPRTGRFHVGAEVITRMAAKWLVSE